jgi:thiosulfate dehydrogenase (quinone) large subunit
MFQNTFHNSKKAMKLMLLEDLFDRVSRATRLEQAVFWLRIFMGGMFLWMGYQQSETPHFDGVLASQLEYWATNNPLFWYQDLLHGILMPLSGIIAFCLPWIQITIGACLILGLFTQFVLPVAIFLNFNILLAAQHTHPALFGLNLSFMVLGLALYWTQCGQYWGIDQWICKPSSNAHGQKSKKKTVKSKPKAPVLTLVEREDRKRRSQKNLALIKNRSALLAEDDDFDEDDDDED